VQTLRSLEVDMGMLTPVRIAWNSRRKKEMLSAIAADDAFPTLLAQPHPVATLDTRQLTVGGVAVPFDDVDQGHVSVVDLSRVSRVPHAVKMKPEEYSRTRTGQPGSGCRQCGHGCNPLRSQCSSQPESL